MLKKKISAALLAMVLLVSLVAFGAAPAALAVDDEGPEMPSFPDVPDVTGEHFAKKEIEFCALNRFVLGFADGTFRPDDQITREQFVTIWARTFHARQHDFSDATKTVDEMDNAIVLMYGLGYINGVSNTRFSRMEKMTREQVAQVVKNTYLQGVEGHDAYKDFSDSSAVSDWARDAVSVVHDKGIFGKIIKNNKLEPNKAITRAEVCVIIYNLMEVMPELFDITIDTTGEGTITANKERAAAGEVIRLTITPVDNNIRLKPGSLKVNDVAISGTTFAMPAEDVVVTAEFEEIPILTSIEVHTLPEKDEYTAGETLDLTGLIITANYSNADPAQFDSGFTTLPAAGTTLDTTNNVVLVSYTESGVTKTTSFSITVNPAT